VRCGCCCGSIFLFFFFFQAEDGIRDFHVTGVQTCALPISGMAEALVQSHRKSIELLPTLPEPWEAGEVSGLMARGGFKLSIQWEDSKLTEATILSLYGKPLQLSYKHSIVIIDETSGISYNGNEVIETVAGHTYRVQLA